MITFFQVHGWGWNELRFHDLRKERHLIILHIVLLSQVKFEPSTFFMRKKVSTISIHSTINELFVLFVLIGNGLLVKYVNEHFCFLFNQKLKLIKTD